MEQVIGGKLGLVGLSRRGGGSLTGRATHIQRAATYAHMKLGYCITPCPEHIVAVRMGSALALHILELGSSGHAVAGPLGLRSQCCCVLPSDSTA
jgi:hypothetical protein